MPPKILDALEQIDALGNSMARQPATDHHACSPLASPAVDKNGKLSAETLIDAIKNRRHLLFRWNALVMNGMAVPGRSHSLFTGDFQIKGRIRGKAVAAPILLILFQEADDGADSAGHEPGYLQLGLGWIKASWITAGEEFARDDPIGPGIGESLHPMKCVSHGVENNCK